MRNDEILLNEIYENSVTAINVISGLLKKTTHQSMFDCLFDEMMEYRELSKKAYDMLSVMNIKPRTKDYYSQIAVLGTMGKPSPNRLARLLISGSTEGFYSLVDSVNMCASAKKDVRQLAYKLMELEEKNVEKMKQYL